jgi:hypothetical protein
MCRPYSAGALRRAAIIGLLILSASCARTDSHRSAASITAPSAAVPESSLHTLVVHVHARGSTAPIADAQVQHEREYYYTDVAGVARLTVASGEETTIAVSAADFHTMQASGTLNGDEQWTFYLEADTQGQAES